MAFPVYLDSGYVTQEMYVEQRLAFYFFNGDYQSIYFYLFSSPDA